MMDQIASVPDFTVAGVTFRCWIAADGRRYEWRSLCGGARVSRSNYARDVPSADGTLRLSPRFTATVAGHCIGNTFLSLRTAVIAAAGALSRERSA